MKGIDGVARAVRGIFRRQRQQANRGKERYGDWNWQLAEALEEALYPVYLSAAKKAKAGADVAEDLVSMVRQRAVEVARGINSTTSEMTWRGDDAFTDARVVRIAETEATYAMGVTMVMGGGKLKWVVGPSACPSCKKFAGRVRKAGSSFGVHEGRMVYHPGLHPFCNCELEAVG